MLPCLVLSMALCTGQAEPAASDLVPPSTPSVTAPDRWLLMKSLQGTWPGWALDSRRIQIYGWTDVSFTASTDQVDQLPIGFNYRANELLLQQNWLRVELPVVTSGTTEPTFGFRSDTILPGSDYRFTLPRGLFNGQLTANHGTPDRYGIDPIQLYAEAYIPTVAHGMDIKLGRIFCQYGVEANDAVSNALCSHAYTFIYDPFTHTGLLTTLKLTDTWSIQAGVMLGSDVFIDPADRPTAMGGFKWAPTSAQQSLLFEFIVGPGRYERERNSTTPTSSIWSTPVSSARC